MLKERRIVVVGNDGIYKRNKNELIEVRPRKQYCKIQLNKIIDAIRYYSSLSDGVSNHYRVAHIIIKNKADTCDDFIVDIDVDNPFVRQNGIGHLSELFRTAEYKNRYWYHWTMEYSKKSGLHWHLMIIGNYVSNNDLFTLRDELSSRVGCHMAVQIIQRSPEYKPSNESCFEYFHNLAEESEKLDAINRYSYQAKLDQKAELVGNSTFNGSRKLKPLVKNHKNVKFLQKQIAKTRSNINVSLVMDEPSGNGNSRIRRFSPGSSTYFKDLRQNSRNWSF